MVGVHERAGALDGRRNLALVQGDSQRLVFVLRGRAAEEDAQIVFGIRHGATGKVLLQKKLLIMADGRARCLLSNADTRGLPVGEHYFDARYVKRGSGGLPVEVKTPFRRVCRVLAPAARV